MLQIKTRLLWYQEATTFILTIDRIDRIDRILMQSVQGQINKAVSHVCTY